MKPEEINILFGCEESQACTKAFRARGFNAYSNDLLPCSGGHPEWHIQGSILDVMNGGAFPLGNDFKHDEVIVKQWHLLIGFPPCTMLAVSGAQWYYHPEDKHLPTEKRRPHPKHPNRSEERERAKEFFMALANAPIPMIAIENPVGIMSSCWRKPDQIIQPWQFGDEATKTTCLWLKGLPLLIPTNIVGKGERTIFASGKSHPKWYADALAKARTPEERRTLRSKTFPGIAQAMAEQWGDYLLAPVKQEIKQQSLFD